jgi:hypothetical protein
MLTALGLREHPCRRVCQSATPAGLAKICREISRHSAYSGDPTNPRLLNYLNGASPLGLRPKSTYGASSRNCSSSDS